MKIEQFAEQHRVKVRRDEGNEVIIPGKVGHIGDGYNDGVLGV
jgi:hypothetical protein